MDISIFLAKFWGWYLIIFFFILSFNPKRIKQIFNALKEDTFLIVGSFLLIVLGLLNILFHNMWEPNWKIIITLIGWGLLCSGLSLLILPTRTTVCLEIINIKFVQVIYAMLFFIGLYLLTIGYSIIL